MKWITPTSCEISLDEFLTSNRVVHVGSTIPTAYKNPTAHPQTLRFGVDLNMTKTVGEDPTTGRPLVSHVSCELVITIGPGETGEVPSAFDRCIHRIDSGVIVGGQAPLLVRADGTSPPVDKALNPDAVSVNPKDPSFLEG